jgi:starch-binding outer membrane protein SusE/F
MPFTLLDPDTNTEYGADGSALAVGGSGITADESGWYNLTADVNALTWSLDAYMIGLVGSATPNGWDAPDQKMDYNAQTGTWSITIDLIDGYIKFRKNDGWAWNLGGETDNLTQGGADIPVTAGNYTITLTIINDETGTCTIVKN